MVFSQTEFLFIFLPLVLIANCLVPNSWRNATLFVLSLAFYANGEKGYVALMLLAICANYVFGLCIRPIDHSSGNRIRLAAGIGLNLGLLIYFKYAAFALDTLGFARPSIHLPLGISFFTFQNISYIVDVYRGDTPTERNPLRLGLYITLFPHLIAGPIVRYREISAEIAERKLLWSDFCAGAEIFTIGLAKKVLVADIVGHAADVVFGTPVHRLDGPLAWLGLWCYMLQIYFDFSGYSDMAIGLARMLGFHFPPNFNYPYAAASIQDFWRRWHMTLSRWFRDYVYFPLGGSKRGNARLCVSLLTVFFLCGLWHGANWTFVIWGLYHGTFLLIERGWFGGFLKHLPRFVAHGYALVVVLIGWVFFRCDNMVDALSFLRALGLGSNVATQAAFHDLATPELVVAMLIGSIGIFPWLPWLSKFEWATPIRRLGLAMMLPLALMAAMSSGYSPFLYFRF